MTDTKSLLLEVLAAIQTVKRFAGPTLCAGIMLFDNATKVMDENTMMSQIETNLLGSVRRPATHPGNAPLHPGLHSPR